MAGAIAGLEKACAGAATDAQTLKPAAESWFAGQPARAERGHVALSLGSGETVVVRRDDVAAAERLDDLFMIRLRPGATVLLRLERSATVGEGCGCEPRPEPAGRIGGVTWPPGELGEVFDWPNTCSIWIQPRVVCEFLQFKDKVRRVCWTEWTVVESCPAPIVPA